MKEHHGDMFKVPSPDIYKVEDVPSLVRVREALAKKGLKDPWLRNDVWRFKFPEPKRWKRAVNGVFRGYRLAIPAVIITIAVEKYLGIDYHPEGSHH